MSDGNLYNHVKNKICDRIFDGTYKEGDKIPAERILAEELNVSRVTVRKSLELLEAERLIIREVGSGTRVSLHNFGRESSMDMIVLIAPAKNPFFSEFIARFQRYAGQQDSMVLYVEKPRRETLENSLYKLYCKGLHNAVVWLEDLPVDKKKLGRLRALGMNLVFFDTDRGLPYADCVSLDNDLAVERLYEELQNCGYRDIAYAGWDNKDIYSIARREKAFVKIAGEGHIFLRLPWETHRTCRSFVRAFLKDYEGRLPEAVLCGDGELGAAMSEALFDRAGGIVKTAMIDEFPGAKDRGVITYTQDLSGSVREIFACLLRQNREGSKWKGSLHKLNGTLNNSGVR